MSGMRAEPVRRASLLWGPLTGLGLAVTLVSAALDQALKLWLIFGFDLGARGIVTLTPFLDLVLTWNKGISYGLFQQDGRSASGRCSRSRPSRSCCCGYGWHGRPRASPRFRSA